MVVSQKMEIYAFFQSIQGKPEGVCNLFKKGNVTEFTIELLIELVSLRKKSSFPFHSVFAFGSSVHIQMDRLYFNLIKVPCDAERDFFDAVSSQRYVMDKRETIKNDLNQLVDCHIERLESDFFNYLENDRKQKRSIPTTQLESYFYLDVRPDCDLDSLYTMNSLRSDSLNSNDFDEDERNLNCQPKMSLLTGKLMSDDKRSKLDEQAERVERASISFERELVFKQIMTSRPELVERQLLSRRQQEPNLFRDENFEHLLQYVKDRKRAASSDWTGNTQLLFDNQNTQLDSILKRKLQRLFELGLIDLETYTKYELLDRLETCRLMEVQF